MSVDERTALEADGAAVIQAKKLTSLKPLSSRSSSLDRAMWMDATASLVRIVSERMHVDELGCNDSACQYPEKVGLAAGLDVSIDGDVWPGSPYAQHIRRCPWHQFRERGAR